MQFAHAVSVARVRVKYVVALDFQDNRVSVVFYKAANNVNFKSQNWSETIAFWLKIDSNQDLKKLCLLHTDHRYEPQKRGDLDRFYPTNDKRMFRVGIAGDEES